MAARKAEYIYRDRDNPDGSGGPNNPSKVLIREWGAEREANDVTILEAIFGQLGINFQIQSLKDYDANNSITNANYNQRITFLENSLGTGAPTPYEHITDASIISFYDPVAAKGASITFAKLMVDISGKLNPMLYQSFLEDTLVYEKPRLIQLEDKERRNFTYQAPEGIDVALNFNKKNASFEANSAIQFAGSTVNYGDIGTASVSVLGRIAEGSTKTLPAKVPYIQIDRLSPGLISNPTYGDNVMNRWPDAVDDRFRAGMRTLLNNLKARGVVDYDRTGAIKFFTWANFENNYKINLADFDGKSVVITRGTTGFVFDPYNYVQAGGTDAYGTTGLTSAEWGCELDSHTLISRSADKTLDTGIAMGNSSQLYLKPNSTLTAAVGRSGAGLDSFPSPAGASAALVRSLSSEFETYSAGVYKNTTQSVLSGIPAGPLNLFSTYAGAGFTSPSVGRHRYFMAGRKVSRQTIMDIETECAALFAICNQIKGIA